MTKLEFASLVGFGASVKTTKEDCKDASKRFDKQWQARAEKYLSTHTSHEDMKFIWTMMSGKVVK